MKTIGVFVALDPLVLSVPITLAAPPSNVAVSKRVLISAIKSTLEGSKKNLIDFCVTQLPQFQRNEDHYQHRDYWIPLS